MSEKSDKFNNITPFERFSKKEIAFGKWRREVRQNLTNNDKKDEISINLNENFELLKKSWSPEYDNLLKEYLDNQNKIPTLQDFIGFLTQYFEKSFTKEKNNSEINLTNDVSLIFDNQNETIQKDLEMFFGEVNFEILDLEKVWTLIEWKEKYDFLVDKYLTNGKLEEHIISLQQFLEEIRNTYQKYKNEQNILESYFARLFLKIQYKIESYKSKIT